MGKGSVWRNSFLVGVAVILLWSSGARADSTWNVATSGTWSDSANWLGGAPTSSTPAVINNSGTALVGVGVSGTYYGLSTGTSAGTSGSINISGGYLSGGIGSTILAGGTGGGGSAVLSSGTWSNGTFHVGYAGTGTLTQSGGLLAASSSFLGNNSSGVGVATISSGTWTNTNNLVIAAAGKGSLTVNGGYLSSNLGFIGNTASGSGTVTVHGGTWATTGTLSVGNTGTGTLLIDGGYVSAGSSVIGSATTSVGSATVSGGLWATSGNLTVGRLGSNAHLTIQTGGTVSSNSAFIGTGTSANAALGSNNVLMVTGSDSVWMISGSLVVGDYGSNNTLTIEDNALVKVGDASGETVVISAHTGTGNFLRLDGGYIALFGDQTNYVTNTLLPASVIEVWSGSSWVSATSQTLDYAFYATDQAALTATGYNGLGGYTILNSVPEPSIAVLSGLGLFGLGAAGLRELRRRRQLAVTK